MLYSITNSVRRGLFTLFTRRKLRRYRVGPPGETATLRRLLVNRIRQGLRDGSLPVTQRRMLDP